MELGANRDAVWGVDSGWPKEAKCVKGAKGLNIIIIIFKAHQHKACRELKIKQEMTAVGD